MGTTMYCDSKMAPHRCGVEVWRAFVHSDIGLPKQCLDIQTKNESVAQEGHRLRRPIRDHGTRVAPAMLIFCTCVCRPMPPRSPPWSTLHYL